MLVKLTNIILLREGVGVCPTQAALTFYHLLGLLFDPEDGGSMFLQNTGELLPNYMVEHP
jgi:hypothetical protein